MKYKDLKDMPPSAVNSKEIQQVINAIRELGEIVEGLTEAMLKVLQANVLEKVEE